MTGSWKNVVSEVTSSLLQARHDLDALPQRSGGRLDERYEESTRQLRELIGQAVQIAGGMEDGSIEQQWADEDRLYAQYGKPLEHERWGDYIAVSRDGRTLLGGNLRVLSGEALDTLGSGTYVVKVGEPEVARWLWSSAAG